MPWLGPTADPAPNALLGFEREAAGYCGADDSRVQCKWGLEAMSAPGIGEKIYKGIGGPG
jgi:hypothetical protein